MIRRFLLAALVAIVAACGGSSGATAPETTVVLASTVSTVSTTVASSTTVKAPAGVPQKALDVLAIIDRTGEPPDGFVGGTTFQNREKRLPQKTSAGKAIKYKEWDVNIKRKGVDRGPERLVTGDDNSAYYTGDHYSTFVRIR